nr:DMT family transporter [Pseudomonadota bacterium]
MNNWATNAKIGYIELTLAQLFLSINTIFGKILVPNYPIFSLLTLRFFLGFSVLGIYLAFTKTKIRTELKAMKKSDWTVLALKALCGGFLFNFLILYGLQYTTATVTGIMSSTLPAFVALFSFIILKEKLSVTQLIAIALTGLGILLLSIGDYTAPESKDLYGLFFIALAMIPAALFTIFSKMINASLKPLTAILLMN